MKIETVHIESAAGTEQAQAVELVMLKLSGAIDPNHNTLQRARELLRKTNSSDMMAAFDLALQNGTFHSKI